MERRVKERLVGAAVLMAAAVILVPEMLSGPPEEKRTETSRASGETPVKTFTIDFSKSAQQSGADVPDTRAPPSELPAPTSEATDDESAAENAELPSQAIPESERIETAGQVASSAPTDAQTSTTAREERAPTPPAAKPPAPATAPSARPPSKEPSRAVAGESARAPIATRESDPRSRGSGWAVQLGSFSSRATADRLTAELESEGYDAFVMPVRTGNATLYRVRIGPVSSREQADATLRKVKGKVPGAAIVSHP